MNEKDDLKNWIEAFFWGIERRIVDFTGQDTVDWLTTDMILLLQGNPDVITKQEYETRFTQKAFVERNTRKGV